MTRRSFRCFLFAVLAGCGGYAKPSIHYYEAGDYAGAARAADEGLARHPDDDGLWGMKIRCALALGDAAAVEKAYAGYASHHDGLDKDLIDDLVVATLGQALASPSAKLKLAAIDAVQDIEIHRLADEVNDISNDDDERVAASAAMAVFHGGYENAIRTATALLQSEDPETRRIIIDGLGKKAGKLALGDLEQAGDDKDVRVRTTALRWLGQLRDRDAVELLTRHLHDKDDGVRAASASALAHIGIGNLGAIAKTALADKAFAVRAAGIELLVASRLAEADLVALTDDADAMLALQAAIAIRKTHPELAAKAIARAIVEPKWTARAGAANLLVAAVGKEAALPLARRLVGDPQLEVRLAAARVLAHGGDPAGAAVVFAAAVDQDIEAAADLADLGDPRGLAALEKAVRDPERKAEQRAAAAAAHRTAHHVTAGLVAALADSNAVVRVEAAHALGMIAK